MKILYLVTKDDVGGAQKYVADLSKYMQAAGHETQTLAGGKNGVRFLSNRIWPQFFFVNDWLAIFETFRWLTTNKPDVVHLNSSKAGIIGTFGALFYNAVNKILGRPKTKVVFTAHGWVFNPSNNLSWLKRQTYIVIHKIAALFQDKIINVSEYDRALAVSHNVAPQYKLTTVHNGLDAGSLKLLDRTTARKTLIQLSGALRNAHASDDIWVGSIGRLVSEKNYKDFIEAASLVKSRKIKFFIIGSGEQEKFLINLIGQRGLQQRFFIIPQLSPASNFLKAFDIFLLSSVKEGLPYTLLEAMAAKVPIIATRVGGIPEILHSPENDKSHAIILPARQSAELARAIEYLVENPELAKNFAETAFGFLKDNFGEQKMGQLTKNLYKNHEV